MVGVRRANSGVVTLQLPKDLATEMARARLFPHGGGSIGAACGFAEGVAGQIGLPVDLVGLLVAELATNAVVHAGSDFLVVIVPDEQTLRVEVHDEDPDGPERAEPAPAVQRGRGLHLLDAWASRWGVTRSATGKAVWFELDRAPRR